MNFESICMYGLQVLDGHCERDMAKSVCSLQHSDSHLSALIVHLLTVRLIEQGYGKNKPVIRLLYSFWKKKLQVFSVFLSVKGKTC